MHHTRILAADAAPSIRLPSALSSAMGTRFAHRAAVEALIEAAIEALDRCDGDTDLEIEPGEPDGDELDFDRAEDDFWIYAANGDERGPGCPIADPGEFY